MANLLKKVSFTGLLLMLCAATAFGQEKKLETIAPAVVAKGAPFNVEYRIAMQPQRINAPSFDGFMLIGNGSSHSTSTAPDGSRYVVHSFTYVLIATEAGNFTIPAASVVVDGQTYTSQPKAIEVVDEGSAAAGGGGRQQGTAPQNQGGTAQQSSSIAGDDLLLRAVPDKTSVYRGEPVRVRFKLYSRVSDLGNEGAKMPTFNGFWSQSLDVSHYQPQRESYNSKVYNTFIIAEYLLYPTQSGTLQIDPLTMNLVVRELQRQQSRSMWDDLMGGFPEVKETKKPVSSAPVTITVKELPANAPASFAGAVGSFSMSSDVPQGTIYANSAVTYKIRISGTGNIPLIQAPKIEMPSSFEQYNSKMTEDTKMAPAGITGSRQFEYPFIARAEGEYRVEPVPFTYFNPQTGEYHTLYAKELSLKVLADTTGGTSSSLGMVGGLSKEDVRILGQDIRFIKHDSPNIRPQGKVLVCSVVYFLSAGLLIALFIFLLFFLQKRLRQMRDDALVRGKKANKVVLARLKLADEYMKEGNQRKFHDEMLRAMWGYMSDKLNIPVANLTKENVREELLKRDIPAEQINRYIDLISECEYAQYSPAESSSMQDKYKTAVEVISKFESYIKR